MATDAEILAKKQILLMELGEPDAVSTAVAPNIDALWNAESGQGGDYLELQYLFVKRKALDLVIGQVRRQASMCATDEQRRVLDLRIKDLRDSRTETQGEINSFAGVYSFNLDIYEPSEII